MENFLQRMHQLLPVLGVDALVPKASAGIGRVESSLLYCEIKGLRATGQLAPSGFVIFKGSQAVLEERASAQKFPTAIAPRRRLIEDGPLTQEGSHFVFCSDTEFTSPSAAATVVHGGSANGLLAWKTADGKTLKDLEAV